MLTWGNSQGHETTSSARPTSACPYCSSAGSWTMHGGKCPKVAEIEYHPDGSVKRVRFNPEPTP